MKKVKMTGFVLMIFAGLFCNCEAKAGNDSAKIRMDDITLEIPCEAKELWTLGKEIVGLNKNMILEPGEMRKAAIVLGDLEGGEITEHTRCDIVKIMNMSDMESSIEDCTVISSAATEWNGVALGMSCAEVKDTLGEPDLKEEDQVWHSGSDQADKEYVLIYTTNVFQYAMVFIINDSVEGMFIVDMSERYPEYEDIKLEEGYWLDLEDLVMTKKALLQRKYGLENVSENERQQKINCTIEGMLIEKEMENLGYLLDAGWYLESDNEYETPECSSGEMKLYNYNWHWGEAEVEYDSSDALVRDGSVSSISFINTEDRENAEDPHILGNIDGLRWASFDVNGITEESDISDIINILGMPNKYDFKELDYQSDDQTRYEFVVDAFTGKIKKLKIVFDADEE